MRTQALAVLAVLALILAAGAAAAMTVDQAKQEFQAKGCTSCHNGALAPTFDGVIKKIQEWAKKYNSLDEAVKAESKNFKMFQNAQSWDQLMSEMPGMTPELKQFFEQVFQQAKGGAGQATATTTAAAGSAGGAAAAPATTVTTTVTQTVVNTVTRTVTEKVLITETVTPVNVEPGTGRLIAEASYVVAILIAIAVVALAYLFYGKK